MKTPPPSLLEPPDIPAKGADDERKLPKEVLDQINVLAKGVEDMVATIKQLTEKERGKQQWPNNSSNQPPKPRR